MFTSLKRYLATANIWRIIGIAGAILIIILFLREPSWPTPDKIIVFLTFIFMALGQAREMLKRLLPFVALLLVYESFRGLAHSLNTHVNYTWMINMDNKIFGPLPTAVLQNWLWHGRVQWDVFVFYIVYMMHFILPIALAILILKQRDKFYWQYVSTFVFLSFMGFLTYLLFPAAPPWMASDQGYIQPIVRISSQVWAALGIHDFPSLYNKIAPNPVAAVPSLHAAYATLLVIFTTKLFGKKWGLLACLYPVLIIIGTVYQGEHYAIDAILGIIYAFIAYFFITWVFTKYTPPQKKKPQNPRW